MKGESAGRPPLVVLGSALAAAAVGILLLRLPGAVPPAGLPAWSAVLIIPGLSLLCVAVHEAGHAGAALLVGFRPDVVVAGPLRLDHAGGRTRLSLNRSLSLAGGLTRCVPAGTRALGQRTMVMAAGGPIASLMFGVQCLAVWVAATGALARGGTAGAAAGFMLLLGGVLSLGMGVVTLLPLRIGRFHTDGARILLLMRDDAAL